MVQLAIGPGIDGVLMMARISSSVLGYSPGRGLVPSASISKGFTAAGFGSRIHKERFVHIFRAFGSINRLAILVAGKHGAVVLQDEIRDAGGQAVLFHQGHAIGDVFDDGLGGILR